MRLAQSSQFEQPRRFRLTFVGLKAASLNANLTGELAIPAYLTSIWRGGRTKWVKYLAGMRDKVGETSDRGAGQGG